MRQFFAMVVFLTAVLSAGQASAQLKIVSATWGPKGGPTCDATASLAAKCDGKEYCQVYADNSQLCRHEFKGWKEATVTYSCNGVTSKDVFPETAQIALPVRRSADGPASCPGGKGTPPNQPTTNRPPSSQSSGIRHDNAWQGNSLPGNSSWMVDSDPNLWVFAADGTCKAKNGYWTGTWKRVHDNQIAMTFKVGSGPPQTYEIGFSPDGKSLTVTDKGRVVRRGVRQ